MFGYHANAIALAQTADELFFEPGELEAPALDFEHFRHVTPYHPTYMNAQLRLVVNGHTASFHVGQEWLRFRQSKLTNVTFRAKASNLVC